MWTKKKGKEKESMCPEMELLLYLVLSSLLLQMDAMGKMRNITELVQSKAYKDKVRTVTVRTGGRGGVTVRTGGRGAVTVRTGGR